jgi:hypothetical protein
MGYTIHLPFSFMLGKKPQKEKVNLALTRLNALINTMRFSFFLEREILPKI